ncbi:hypothetical protein GGR56DRAFT_614977 [Xylariaceae sp. FL0804]|nr:hypothetical protein GGR56DRAFT_614977 [Xylariaceae sp. FL0804]
MSDCSMSPYLPTYLQPPRCISNPGPLFLFLSLHSVLKLYSAGIFRRFPGLRVIVGHMGELLPMMIDRVDGLRFFHARSGGGLGERFSDVWARNVWVTSSGVFSARALEMLLRVTARDRVLYSVDTPFNASRLGWDFLRELADRDVLSSEDLDAFAFGNAQKLFNLNVDLQKM